MKSLTTLSLLAETRFNEVDLSFREETADGGISIWWYLLIAVAAVIIAAAIYKFYDRPVTVLNTPMGMLHELCRVHRVNGRSRSLLERIAEAADMKHPAVIFLGRAQFDAALKVASKKIQFDKKDNAALGLMRRRLFNLH